MPHAFPTRRVSELVVACRPCRRPPSSNASVMRMTTIHAQAERKRQDRSVCRAEKRLCRARMLRVQGLIHPTSAVCATTDTARGEKRLPSEQNQAILKSSGGPLGECRLGTVRILIACGYCGCVC